MKARCLKNKKFDTSIYHGAVKNMVEGMNNIIERHKPETKPIFDIILPKEDKKNEKSS